MLQLLPKLVNFGAFDLGECDPRTNAGQFFGFPHWWQYIDKGHKDGLGNCVPEVHFPDGIWAIVFAVIDMLLYLAGLVAVVMIIVSGVTYLTSLGNTERAVSARKRLVNAIIGLIIVLIASAGVAFIGKAVG